jgi:DNA-binding CsgD family transcriptional regulator
MRQARGAVPTPSEPEALRLVGEDLATAEVGGRLGIAPMTADSHMKSAVRKRGARTRRQEATAVATE